MAQGNNRPNIIRRKKVIAPAVHNGGAWKVAYADFVTAMMAFFLMMWLLSATTDDQRKGLADYFSPEIPVARDSGGGDGMLSGFSLVPGEEMPASGQGSDGDLPDKQVFEAIQSLLRGSSGESSVADELLAHVNTRVTDEGLIISIFDLPEKPLFDGIRPKQTMRTLVAIIDDAFRMTPNDVAVYGHVGADAVVLRNRTVWPLSTGRAQAVRALLSDGFTTEDRIARITAFADNKLLHPDPRDIRNNRIELVLLRKPMPR